MLLSPSTVIVNKNTYCANAHIIYYVCKNNKKSANTNKEYARVF